MAPNAERAMIIIDLFAGLGGNSLAFDTIFHEQKNTHIFCEIDPYCQAILRKHWPGSYIHGNVRSFTDAETKQRKLAMERKPHKKDAIIARPPFLLTGGFPCQPFSQAGRRKGTEDDRHLWPAMLGVIRHCKPTWIIAENVRGLLTIEGGLVFETVCSDMESAGYEVQPFVIPAVAVGAPHRRDRIWFIAHLNDKTGDRGSGGCLSIKQGLVSSEQKRKKARRATSRRDQNSPEWNQDWHEIAAELCGVDDGLPAELDRSKLSNSAHRNARLIALGNAIVPQVAMEIMQAIKNTQAAP